MSSASIVAVQVPGDIRMTIVVKSAVVFVGRFAPGKSVAIDISIVKRG
jgi:hypothetical protein